MRPFASILLVVVFLALGTGGLAYVHNLDHARADARRAAAGDEPGVPSQPASPHPGSLPDENNCDTHARLHQTFSAAGWTPLLVFLGLFVAFLTLLTPDPVSHRPLPRLDCRGPPAC